MSDSHFDSPPLGNLTELGWKNFYNQQLNLDEWETLIPARIIEQHKSIIVMSTEAGCIRITPNVHFPQSLTVGDWVLLDQQQQLVKRLDRQSKFSRKAPGSKQKEQLIAANVDTLLIVCSLNHDFNLNRIERYLVLAHEAQVEPVIILSKADLCESTEIMEDLIQQVQGLDPYLMVIAMNALQADNIHVLAPWCKPGKTLALVGSSGVGKSTLANLLLGKSELATGDIREDDSKGRHTTTSRSLHIIPKTQVLSGGILLDTPGMRELQLANVEHGIEETFTDILTLAEKCKFSDCQHDQELSRQSGCAVQAAIERGELSARRLLSYQKLQKEDAFNSASMAEKRHKDKQLGKMIHSIQKDMRARKNK